MLKYLHLENVGPAPEMELQLAPRLNLITGDNGLGKSFLLDIAWWALTRRWPHDVNPRLTTGYKAVPRDKKKPANIGFRLTSKTGEVSYSSPYSPRDEAWTGRAGRPWNPGLVVYAHSDGGFSVWDPKRNYWKTRGNIDVQERLPAYVFSPREVWDGLKVEMDGNPTQVCNGLLLDWANWIRERGEDAEQMAEVVRALSPPDETFQVGPLVRLSVNDARDIPSIETPYAGPVPVLHASSGVRRIIALAYVLTWSRREHLLAAEHLGEESTSQVVLLFDEIEGHLHPRWQRTILKSLLGLSEALHELADVQLLTATHSPLLLASAEPYFDPEKDSWFDLDLDRQEDSAAGVRLTQREYVRRGDVSDWLTSEAFDLREARSIEAEEALSEALALLRSEDAPTEADLDRVEGMLRATLSDVDRFWLRWTAYRNSLGGRP